jgi:hypothetical protein
MLNVFNLLKKNLGMSLEEAIEKIYGKSLDSLEQDWKKDLQ